MSCMPNYITYFDRSKSTCSNQANILMMMPAPFVTSNGQVLCCWVSRIFFFPKMDVAGWECVRYTATQLSWVRPREGIHNFTMDCYTWSAAWTAAALWSFPMPPLQFLVTLWWTIIPMIGSFGLCPWVYNNPKLWQGNNSSWNNSY